MTVLGASAVTAGLLARGPAPGPVVGFLTGSGQTGYAVWFGWLLGAPLFLAGAAVSTRRTPWPWIAAVTLHLASLLAGAVLVSHWLTWWAWGALAVAVLTGLGSIATLLVQPTIGRGPGAFR